PISIIYTSGTTSLAKGVIHSHGSFLRSAQRWAAGMDYRSGDRIYNAAPFFWVGGLVTGLLITMEVGATLIGCSYSGARLADFVVAERCTLLATSKLAAEALKAVPDLMQRDFSALRGGSLPDILPPHLRTRNQIYFGNALGMTETAGPHTLAIPDVDDAHIGSMGPLAPGMEHRLIDRETRQDVGDGERGELLVRGDTLMLGYVGRERADVLDMDGWFHTGDLCSYRDGHLFLHGRIDNLIKVSGANVAPAEVEAALTAIAPIQTAYATGFPDKQRGQIVGALVTLAAGATLDPEAVTRELRSILAPYKVPRVLVVTDALPTTATSKVDQRRAKTLIEEGVNLLPTGASREPA
ncbi:MAG: fatty acid--CoA ligase family protein, partial [Sphingobium sp.]